MKRQKTLRLGLFLFPMLLLMVMLISTTAFAAEPDFTGYTAISTKEQLNAVRNNLSGKYYLTTDIVFTAEDFAYGGSFYDLETNGAGGWKPIGSEETPFTGIFDGNGYTITGLKQYISDSSTVYGGLFGYLKGGTIRNLGMVDSEIAVETSSGTANAGGIVGCANSRSTISNCYNTGSVTAAGDVYSQSGGIAGVVYNSSTISNCYNTGNVAAGDAAGGIAGYMEGSISNCYNTGSVVSRCCFFYAGGIVGEAQWWNSTNTISNCYYLDQIDQGVGGGIDPSHACTIEELKQEATYVGFDFTNVWQMGNGEYPLPVLKSVAHVAEPPINKAEFAGGNGTPYAPYEIADKTHLNNVRNYPDAYFNLMANIKFTAADFSASGSFCNEGIGWQPIGSEKTPFTGIFDGRGHTITGLKQNMSGSNTVYGGLFGYMNGGMIQNLGMVDSEIAVETSSGDAYVGAIAGYANGCGKVSNCYNTGSVTATGYNSCAGGITGNMELNSTISNCYNTGSVTAIATSPSGTANAGGIAGCGGSSSAISNCYNTGSVTATGSNSCAGGIAGQLEWSGTISSCYNTGSVSALGLGSNAGGIAGAMFGDGSNSYYLDRIGKEVGWGADTATICTINQMQEQATYVGFDFTNVWQMGNGEYPLPVLRSVAHVAEPPMSETKFAGGNGTPYAPYEIANKTDLNNMRNYPNACFKMTANIEFTLADFSEGGTFYNDGSGWQPIGSEATPFTGIFDGNGHTITGLKQNISGSGDVYGGLFGYVSGGSIRNLGMVDSEIAIETSSGAAYTGGITGYVNSGTISNCYNTGSVTATGGYNSCAGGIAGCGGRSSTISKCYNIGNVSAGAAGGIAGYVNNGTISSCYNTGSVSGYGVGGITGHMEWSSSIGNCYNTGRVSGYDAGGITGHGSYDSTISNCYNTGSVTAGSHAGGIAGDISGSSSTISNCYNTGSVALTETDSTAYAGGIAGNVYGDTIKFCYYINNIDKGVGFGTDAGTKCTEEELQKMETFVGFNFKSVWTMKGSETYPYPELRVHQPGVTISGTVVSWNNTDNAVYLLYNSEISDEDIKVDMKLNNPIKALMAADVKGDIMANIDGKRYDQTFSFSTVTAGTYKVAIFKPGKYVPKIVELTVEDSDYDCGQQKLWLKGDVNNSGTVDYGDLQCLYQHLSTSNKLTGEALGVANTNEDGTVDYGDLQRLYQHLSTSNKFSD